MNRDRNAQCLGRCSHMKMLGILHLKIIIWKIIVNSSALALTCYKFYYFGWSPLL